MEDGFIIGPLGVPVRKTIEVGNRGVQKAFSLAQNLGSPQGRAPQSLINGGNVGVVTSEQQSLYNNNDYKGNHNAPIAQDPYFQYQDPRFCDPYSNPSVKLLNPPVVVQPMSVSLLGTPIDLQQERDFRMKLQKVDSII